MNRFAVRTFRAAIGAAALAAVALPAGTAAASPSYDGDPPNISFRPGVAFRLGSVLSDTTATASLPVAFTWTQYDESGICGRSARLSHDGTDQSVAIRPTATSYSTDLRSGGYASLDMTSTDCSPQANTDESYAYASTTVVQQGAFTLSAGWRSQMCNCWSGGGDIASTKKGASATYRFSGGSVALVGVTSNIRGRGAVYLDGVLVANVNEYVADPSRALNRVVVFQRQFPTSGTHTLKVVSTTAAKFDIDALVVS